MIILGDISGIQNYLFDVNEAGGGQARRLRARSFLIQALAEFAALRVLMSMNWTPFSDHFLFAGAGKFILRGNGDPDTVQLLNKELNWQLLRESMGELRLALAMGTGGSDVADYRQAQMSLQQAKSSPWQPTQDWEPGDLVLPPLDTPCTLCRRAPATEDDADPDDGKPLKVCRQCYQTFQLGRVLPSARFMVIRDGFNGQFSWLGISGQLMTDIPTSTDARFLAIMGLDGQTQPPIGCPTERFISRRAKMTIPLDPRGNPVWFTDLAKMATGDPLLAVLKADVDWLGVAIEQRLSDRTELTDFLQFAESLDRFFADELRQEIARDGQWHSIYTVFAGGDDLVMIGPWDVMLRFAGQLREWFRMRFPGLTLSAGVSFFKPKRPIRTAIEQSNHLLDLAKEALKDQCAALGQVWNWSQHSMILHQAEELVRWVQSNQMQRGWLHTLLEMAVVRHCEQPDLLATARLAYQVSRWVQQNPNFRRSSAARAWAENSVSRFDDANDFNVRYLPAILRHALTATRTAGGEE